MSLPDQKTEVALRTIGIQLNRLLISASDWVSEDHEECRCWLCERLPMALEELIAECEQLIEGCKA